MSSQHCFLLLSYFSLVIVCISAAKWVNPVTHFSCDVFTDARTKTHFQALHDSNAPLSFDSNNEDYDIFLKLVEDAGLKETIFDNKDEKVSIYIPRDLAMKQSAVDINFLYANKTTPINKLSESQAYGIIVKFVNTFSSPNLVLKKIVQNHVVKKPDLSMCRLFDVLGWSALSGQRVNRAGISLVSENELFFHPMIYLEMQNTKTEQGFIHSIDRMVMPNLSSFTPSVRKHK